MSSFPRVFLVGAGPGNSGLLTLRAVECLRLADLVLYDSLVPEIMLAHVPSAAERLCITELGPRHCERVHAIQQKMIEAVKQGKCVVRLKGGDSFLFGRGGEEVAALREAGIPFEVVPGVTAALGASAFAGIPLTHRGVSSAVAFVTGHDDPALQPNPPGAKQLDGEVALDWQALARFPGTLVIYMGLARIESIVRTLIENGKSADTPAAVIESATTGAQRTIPAPLSNIAEAVQRANLVSPSLILIGPVVELREKLAWFEQRPLLGRRVLICRPKEQAGELVHRLEVLGAVPLVLPVIEIGEPADWGPVDQAIDRLSDFQWLVFTSVNGVQAFINRLLKCGRDLRALGHLRLAAIGPATAAALRSFHLEPDVVPEDYRSESLAAALKPHVAGQRVLLARADRGRDVLRDELQSIAQVHQIAVYSQVDVIQPDHRILKQFSQGLIDEVILTSSNIARSMAKLLDAQCQEQLRAGQTRVFSISPVTSATIRELGWPVAAEAKEYTMEGVLEALLSVPCQQTSGISANP